LVRIVTVLPCTVALAVAISALEAVVGVLAGAVVAVGVLLLPVAGGVELPQAVARSATSARGTNDLRSACFMNVPP